MKVLRRNSAGLKKRLPSLSRFVPMGLFEAEFLKIIVRHQTNLVIEVNLPTVTVTGKVFARLNAGSDRCKGVIDGLLEGFRVGYGHPLGAVDDHSLIGFPGGIMMPTDLTGKASFGFVSMYKKGASLPSGNQSWLS